MVKVALMKLEKDAFTSFQQALELLGGIQDLDMPEREVLLKVGVFSPKQKQHTTVPVAKAIVDSFIQSPKIWFIESDNYRGSGLERLKIWSELFSERVQPYNLSSDTKNKTVKIGEVEMNLSHMLFESRVLVSSHTLRWYEKGSVMKNLFGLPPMKKKAQFHKNLIPVILDLFEAVGGIDLAVLDGTFAYPGPGAGVKTRIPANLIVVGRDAVAVDAVGAALMGGDPEKMPIIQEAINRGLGEGNLDNIKIVGCDFTEIQTTLQQYRKSKKL
ncbi:MAG: DUF362 domain-containing protein [Candidatus Thorarchaeota archaeon]